MNSLQPESHPRRSVLLRATLSGALGLALLVGVLLLVGVQGSVAQGPPPPDVEAPSGPEGVDVGRLVEDLRAGVPLELEPPHWPESAEVSRMLETVRAAAPPVPEASQAGVALCVDPANPGTCYTTIQAAIDAAPPGALIEVAAGTYHEHITVTKDLGIYGAGWGSTIIDGGYAAAEPTVFIDGVSASTVISGVQVTGGGTVTPGTNYGGGMAIWYASPRIVNTMVYSCTADIGGGILVWIGQPLFQNVAVLGCRAANYGGGYYLQDSEVAIMGDPSDIGNGAIWFNSVTNNEGGGIFVSGGAVFLGGLNIYWNSAPYGGGISIYNTGTQQVTAYLNDIAGNSAAWHGGGLNASLIGELEVAVNYIRSNTAQYNGAGAWFNQADGTLAFNSILSNTCSSGTGGGVAVDGGSEGLLIHGNFFQGNASGGGALSAQTGAAPTVNANIFVSNTSNIGGAIWTYQAGEMEVTNNIMAHNVTLGTPNTGGGVAIIESPARVINNTIADNTGDGIFYSAANDAVIVNNVMSGNSRYGLSQDTMTTTTGLVADYNDFYGNTLGARSNVAAGAHDRLFNPTYVASGNPGPYYHIQPSSPISTTGSTTWAPADDFDSDRRRTRGTVSMGADEIPAPVTLTFLPLVLK